MFIQYQWWFKSEFKGLWIKLTKRFLDLCFLLQIFDYCFFQIKTMLSLGFKAEIQALSSISFNFLSETYLPVKIKHGRWIWCQNYHLACTVLHIYSHLRKQWQHLFEGIVTRATDFFLINHVTSVDFFFQWPRVQTSDSISKHLWQSAINDCRFQLLTKYCNRWLLYFVSSWEIK